MVYSVCFALVSLSFDMDCYILFSEHRLTSFLSVSQLQLEVFLAPVVYLVSVNPTTFRDEPIFGLFCPFSTFLNLNHNIESCVYR